MRISDVSLVVCKHKTAYELRISDWSSDVCSSDLAAGAGTDDADRLRALARRRHRLHPAFLPGGVGDVLLDRADGDRAVARLLDDTVAFEEPVLGTDPPADLGEMVGRLGQLVGIAPPPLPINQLPAGRAEERRCEKECVRKCRSGWQP